jgi:hypothetical protein
MPNPWVSLRCDQLIPVNKAVSEKEQLEKGMKEEGKRRRMLKMGILSVDSVILNL